MSSADILRNLQDVIQSSGIQHEQTPYLQGAVERLQKLSALPPIDPVLTDWAVEILRGYAEEKGKLSEEHSASLIALSMLCKR